MREKMQVITVAVLFFSLSVIAWLKPADQISDSELRKLKQLPEINIDNVLSGNFMKEFESYTLDQFPFRDGFRRLKAVSSVYLLRQLDNNGIYIQDGYLAKMEYPYDNKSVQNAVDKFNKIYQQNLKGTDVNSYFTIIPDKNYFLSDEHGALSIDYNKMISEMKQGMEFAEYIDIADKLDEKDYYYTDTHWNQIYITDVAQTLAENMGVKLDDNYETITADTPFYGVYYGQAALPVEPDKMQYLTNDDIKNSIVYDWQNNREIEIYNESMLNTRSPYDLFLGGSISLITIENKVASTDKELVVFRDSFGSSIVPLLISGYKKITLVDIRYLTSNRISDFIEFENQDVLFMYSTLVLNNSSPLK